MTRRPPSRPLRAFVCAVVAGSTLLASGCGTTDALVGLHPAPAEAADAAPLDEDGAAAIAARLLAEARATAATKGEKGDAAREKVMRGDALVMANQTASRGAASDDEDDLAREVEPTVVAQSSGKDWPRAILATTLDTSTSTQYLHVMVSRDPAEPFRIEASVPMLGGAELPSVGGENAGAPFVDPAEGTGLVMSPKKAFEEYGAALRTPKPKKARADVSTDDSFATALRDSATRQDKALGKLGTYTQKHDPRLKNTVAFRLADGGVVAFGLLRRTDTFEPSSKAKELRVPSQYAKLVGTKKVTEEMQLVSYEPVILVVPVDGDVKAIGATELLVSGKGS